MTYWAMNAVFLAAVAAVGVLALVRGRHAGGRMRRRIRARALLAALVLLLVLTAVFDNVMIGVGLVGYDESRISGLLVGIAPIEDFTYTVAAVVLLPSLWTLLGRRGSGAAAEGPGRGASADHGSADIAPAGRAPLDGSLARKTDV